MKRCSRRRRRRRRRKGGGGGGGGGKWQKLRDAELTARQAQEWLQRFGAAHLIIQLSIEEPLLSLTLSPLFPACYNSPHLQPIRGDTQSFGSQRVSRRNNPAQTVFCYTAALASVCHFVSTKLFAE